jgi:hypothetical protein
MSRDLPEMLNYPDGSRLDQVYGPVKRPDQQEGGAVGMTLAARNRLRSKVLVFDDLPDGITFETDYTLAVRNRTMTLYEPTYRGIPFTRRSSRALLLGTNQVSFLRSRVLPRWETLTGVDEQLNQE